MLLTCYDEFYGILSYAGLHGNTSDRDRKVSS